MALARAWPELEWLNLALGASGWHYDWNSREYGGPDVLAPSTLAFVYLAENCPHLADLRVPSSLRNSDTKLSPAEHPPGATLPTCNALRYLFVEAYGEGTDDIGHMGLAHLLDLLFPNLDLASSSFYKRCRDGERSRAMLGD